MRITREMDVLDLNERLLSKLIGLFDDKIDGIMCEYNLNYESSGCSDKRQAVAKIREIFESIDWDGVCAVIDEMEEIEEEVDGYNNC